LGAAFGSGVIVAFPGVVAMGAGKTYPFARKLSLFTGIDSLPIFALETTSTSARVVVVSTEVTMPV